MVTRYVHTNLVSRNWRKLADFYQTVFDCEPVLPERDLSGNWLDKATGIEKAHITGIHLRLPGFGDKGPTLEIFQYENTRPHPEISPDMPGYTHIAFAVDDVAATAAKIREKGGRDVGELTRVEVSSVGQLTFQYLADPEGNIIEIQCWMDA